ncbi:hypothetical protein HOY80DRAFT_946930 [Tuber brumale]|nr:hypothetical protein HOY80DRAFT_946930 [Tuber brumale]
MLLSMLILPNILRTCLACVEYERNIQNMLGMFTLVLQLYHPLFPVSIWWVIALLAIRYLLFIHLPVYDISFNRSYYCQPMTIPRDTTYHSPTGPHCL